MTTIIFFDMDQKKLMKKRPLKDIYPHPFMSSRPPLLPNNNEDQTFLRCVLYERTQRELHCETQNKVHQEVSDGYSGVLADIKPEIENS